MPTPQQDTEITLGTGRMLALFFTFVLVCAVFFAIGFSLGRKTSLLGVNKSANASPSAAAATVKPSAPKDDATAQSTPQASDFSFYKSVGSNNANTELTPPEPPAPAPTTTASEPAPPPPPPATNSAPAAGSYVVQVAAVTRQEDAEALVEALKKKEYPAFAANNSSVDKYYHVQLGPYANMKDAEAMRARLIADGYNPIIKK